MFKRRSIIGLVLLMIVFIFTVKSSRKVNFKNKVKKLEFEKIDTIEIKAHNVNVEIISTNEKLFTLEWVGDQSKLKQFKAYKKTSTFVVKIKSKRQNLFSRFFYSHISFLKVYVPEKVYQSLHLEADKGDIDLTNLHSDNVKIISDNGKVNLTDVDGKLVVKADNDDISLITDHIDRDIDFETDNADIMVQTEVEPKNVLFDIKTDDGEVDVFGSTDWNTFIGNGNNTVRLKTDKGGITVKKFETAIYY